MLRVTPHRRHQVRNQVGASLELYVYFGPGLLHLLIFAHHFVALAHVDIARDQRQHGQPSNPYRPAIHRSSSVRFTALEFPASGRRWEKSSNEQVSMEARGMDCNDDLGKLNLNYRLPSQLPPFQSPTTGLP